MRQRSRPAFRAGSFITLAAICALGAAASLVACGGSGDIAEGGECQVCREKAPKCDSGMTCSTFQGNFTYGLCAKPTTKECKVPF